MTDRTTPDHSEPDVAQFVHPESEISVRVAESGLDGVVSSLPLVGETVAFTGTLASMTHREGIRVVEQYGGRATHTVSGSTTMLVIGEEGWPLEPDGGTSQKLQQTTQLIEEGADTKILAESDWLQLLGLAERREEIRRAHTPAMLSRLLDVPVRMIRRWARLGLIRPVRRVCRLPYFDYREVASARRLAMLLDQGVSPEVLERSLGELSHTMAGTDRSLAQLNLLVQDDKILMRDDRGVLNPRTGQRLLDFDLNDEFGVYSPSEEMVSAKESANQDSMDGDDETVSIPFPSVRSELQDRRMADWNAEEWFHEGCRLTEEAELESAINAFRNAMSLLSSELASMRLSSELPLDDQLTQFPDPADVNFHMADALYRSGRTEAAIERYYCAIESAPDYIEAWTQLGCLQSELLQPEAAEQSLITAISIHPGNPDALLHYAQLLDQAERTDEAVEYWKKYLEHDSRGPWSEHARDRIARVIPVAVPAADLFN
ncbi:MAG TPA: tetratricopeptide repeat protein [Planctomycetaceae bacterium]|nr:tetratricopeptide repeat protein [Planctomycetaceae bacterium]